MEGDLITKLKIPVGMSAHLHKVKFRFCVCLYCAPTKAAKRSVHAVGSVRGRHDNNMNTLLQAIHQGEQLRDNPSLNLPVRLRT